MRRSQGWVDFASVKAAVTLRTVLRLYRVDWLKTSRQEELRGRCPIHQKGGEDAFHASLTKNAFQCFHCGARGNVLDFVAAMERCSIRQAALLLQERFDVGRVQTESMLGNRESKLVPKKEECNPPLDFLLGGVDPCHPYLAKRGITPATARHFGVGFYGGPGLLRGRIVIPIQDEQGRTVAYGGRSLDGQAPRYKLPVGFRKSLVLFNLHRAARCASDTVVVVEGFFDCMKIHQAGFTPVIALMGSRLTVSQEELLLGCFRRVALLLDDDAAGRAGTTAIVSQLAGKCELQGLQLPTGAQPDQLSSQEIQQLLARLSQKALTTSAKNHQNDQ